MTAATVNGPITAAVDAHAVSAHAVPSPGYQRSGTVDRNHQQPGAYASQHREPKGKNRGGYNDEPAAAMTIISTENAFIWTARGRRWPTDATRTRTRQCRGRRGSP